MIVNSQPSALPNIDSFVMASLVIKSLVVMRYFLMDAARKFVKNTLMLLKSGANHSTPDLRKRKNSLKGWIF